MCVCVVVVGKWSIMVGGGDVGGRGAAGQAVVCTTCSWALRAHKARKASPPLWLLGAAHLQRARHLAHVLVHGRLQRQHHALLRQHPGPEVPAHEHGEVEEEDPATGKGGGRAFMHPMIHGIFITVSVPPLWPAAPRPAPPRPPVALHEHDQLLAQRRRALLVPVRPDKLGARVRQPRLHKHHREQQRLAVGAATGRWRSFQLW